MIENKTLFIKIDDFEKVSKAVEEIKEKTAILRQKIAELKQIKTREDQAIKDWEQKLNKLNERISQVELSLSLN